MNILAYLNFIKRKVDRLNRAVENPINKHIDNNPFTSSFNKTYVWVDRDDYEDFLR